MKSNEEILRENRTKIESAEGIHLNYAMLDAMKEAQIEILDELIKRYTPTEGGVLMRKINELKEELK